MAQFSNMFALNAKQLTTAIDRLLPTGLVASVMGSPGIGKSDLIRSIAKSYNLFVIDIRLSQASPEDLNGFPAVVNGKATFMPFDHFPTADKEPPKGYQGWLIFFDEITSAVKAVQAAAYKVILDRYVGNHPLHPMCAVITAGNMMSDKAVVIQQSTALQSRMTRYQLIADAPIWIEWAHKNKKDPRVSSFISFNPSAIHVFDPDKVGNEMNFPCPRTWDFVCRYIWDKPKLDFIDQATVVGQIGQGMGVEFFQYCKVWETLRPISEILADPTGVVIPNAHGDKFAALGYLTDLTDTENFGQLLPYVQRFPEELQSVFMKGVAHRQPAIKKHKEYVKNTVKLLRFIGEDEDNVFADA